MITVGLAGHIDHGKTALTKALTNMDTDRLQEEKKRRISIENGFAYIDLNEDTRVAVIDVPGHEKFIRQMIAGAAGVDLAMLVVAADEGVMPQTKEHLDIIKLLNIKQIMVVLTKCSLVDEEMITLATDDIEDRLEAMGYQNTPIYPVDSLAGKGIDDLRKALMTYTEQVDLRQVDEPLRLPIDDVFTIHGSGTVARGTIFNGEVHKNDQLTLLPQKRRVRVRELQVHHRVQNRAVAGQRAAVNLSGINHGELKRGDVIVDSDSYQSTKRLDIQLETIDDFRPAIKQRHPILFHIGTSAVMGRLILFDRNQLGPNHQTYAQVELEEAVIVKKGDRYVIRRPSPAATIGGGMIIDAEAEKHRFGSETVALLKEKAKQSPDEMVLALLHQGAKSEQELLKETGLSPQELKELLNKLSASDAVLQLAGQQYVSTKQAHRIQQEVLDVVGGPHDKFPMQFGIEKATLIQRVFNDSKFGEALMDYMDDKNKIVLKGPYVALPGFVPNLPDKWRRRMETVIEMLKRDRIKTQAWADYGEEQQIPIEKHEALKAYLLASEQAYELNDKHLIHRENLEEALSILRQEVQAPFTVQDAKAALQLTRKFTVFLLEVLDRRGDTIRIGNERKWKRVKAE